MWVSHASSSSSPSVVVFFGPPAGLLLNRRHHISADHTHPLPRPSEPRPPTWLARPRRRPSPCPLGAAPRHQPRQRQRRQDQPSRFTMRSFLSQPSSLLFHAPPFLLSPATTVERNSLGLPAKFMEPPPPSPNQLQANLLQLPSLLLGLSNMGFIVGLLLNRAFCAAMAASHLRSARRRFSSSGHQFLCQGASCPRRHLSGGWSRRPPQHPKEAVAAALQASTNLAPDTHAGI